MSKNSKIYSLAILIFITTACLSNYIYFKNDNSILGCDSGNHLFFSIEFFHEISDILYYTSRSTITKIVEVAKLIAEPVNHSTTYWPNGLNLTTSVFYFLFGKSLFAAKLGLLPYLFILLLSVYAIGKSLSSKFVGLIAAFILLMYPIIFESSRQFQLDFPLAAMVALNILLLLKSNCFQSRKYSLFFGLSLGWAMLIKGQAILFIIWPLLFILYTTFRTSWKIMLKQHLRSIQLQNMVVFLLLAVLISSLWWGHQFPIVKSSLREHIFAAHKTIESGYIIKEKYSLPIISFYIKTLFTSLSPFLFSAFLVSLFSLKGSLRFKGLYLSWILMPFLLFSLVFSIKDIRFLMPILPAMALITAWGINRIKNRAIQTLALSSIIIFSLTQFFLLSYSDSELREASLSSFKIFSHNTGYENVPHKENINVDGVIQVIEENTLITKPVIIGFVNCGIRSSFETLYFLKIRHKFISSIDLLEMPTLFLEISPSMEYILFRQPLHSSIKWPEGKEFKELLQKTHSQRTFTLEHFHQLYPLFEVLEDIKSNFQLIAKVPSGRYEKYVYYIYKKVDQSTRPKNQARDAL